tara:strand:- start:2716 stop:3162 length:447 start_codon:yes stop_codon:yes gene_type:complete
MSFTVNLLSEYGMGDSFGRQYNFNWANTPKHDGKYKVHMTFTSNILLDSLYETVIIKTNLNSTTTFTPSIENGTHTSSILGSVRSINEYNPKEDQYTHHFEANTTINMPILLDSKPSNNSLSILFYTLDDVRCQLPNEFMMSLFFEAI